MKITCLNCKHLMFSDMYGECKIQLRIVNPSDTCEYAEPKERGSEELRKKQMTTKNAIKILKRLYPALSSAGKEAIGEAVEALEKQIPKKPDRGHNIFDKEDEELCPVCGNPNPDTYCGTCGQRIDWSDENGTND